MPHSVHTTPRSASPLARSGAYWNVNIAELSWTEACPDFLSSQSAKNVSILSTKDEDARSESWAEVQQNVRTNRIDRFQRTPIELRRYLEYCYHLKRDYGSVLTFIQEKRLFWKTTTPSGDAPFTNSEDYRILFNDWPYAIEPDVSHLVVWTKFLLEDDPATDDLTDQSRKMLENFVGETFCDETEDGIPREQVVWFKNWKSLKSVHALEHFHVMLFKAPKELLARVTGGDRPMSEKLKH